MEKEVSAQKELLKLFNEFPTNIYYQEHFTKEEICKIYEEALNELKSKLTAFLRGRDEKLTEDIRKIFDTFDVVGFLEEHNVYYDEWLKSQIFQLLTAVKNGVLERLEALSNE